MIHQISIVKKKSHSPYSSSKLNTIDKLDKMNIATKLRMKFRAKNKRMETPTAYSTYDKDKSLKSKESSSLATVVYDSEEKYVIDYIISLEKVTELEKKLHLLRIQRDDKLREVNLFLFY